MTRYSDGANGPLAPSVYRVTSLWEHFFGGYCRERRRKTLESSCNPSIRPKKFLWETVFQNLNCFQWQKVLGTTFLELSNLGWRSAKNSSLYKSVPVTNLRSYQEKKLFCPRYFFSLGFPWCVSGWCLIFCCFIDFRCKELTWVPSLVGFVKFSLYGFPEQIFKGKNVLVRGMAAKQTFQ